MIIHLPSTQAEFDLSKVSVKLNEVIGSPVSISVVDRVVYIHDKFAADQATIIENIVLGEPVGVLPVKPKRSSKKKE